jgi:translation initiation factor 3 subunit C
MIWGTEENEIEDEIKIEKKTVQPKAGKAYAYGESESSEEEKRVLKTPKEKLLSTIKDNYLKIKDNIDARNFVDILQSFDELIKNADKIKKEFGDKLPPFFVRTLYLVEESLNIQKEDKSRLSKENNTAFNSLKKSFKSAKPFEEAIKNYRESKSKEDYYEEEAQLSDLSDESKEKSQLSDISSEVDLQADKNEDPAVRRLKWVKKPKDEKDKDKEKEKEAKKKQAKKGKVKVEKIFAMEDEEELEKVKEVVEKKQAITDNDIEKECNEISNQRGHVQRPLEIVSRIDYLLSVTDNNMLKIKLLNLYILICFDTSPGQFSALSLEMWNKIHDSIISLLNNYNNLNKLSSNDENLNNQIKNISFMLQGSLVSILEKLELELYKALQYTDQNSSEYITRIRDELKFLLLCSKIESFYTEHNDQISISRIYLLIILHIYYKNEESIKKMIERFNINVNRDEYLIKSCENPENFMNQLCEKIYAFCDEKSKLKAMLCNIYFLCIHNHYNAAKHLFKRSYVFELIQILKDDQLKILYNRTLAQLGLCSFRLGKFADSLEYLHPLCQTGTIKLKEYLAQSYNKDNEKSIFFEKEEKKRMIPYIMTINIDEIESTYYLISMVVDLPNILLFKLGKNHNEFNHVFKKLLDNYEKQIFNGPPETIKELILSSATYLIKGDWKKCSELISTLRIYNHHKCREEIKNFLNTSIRETALKCFLIFYSNQYNSFSLSNLNRKFNIEPNQVRKIVNRMILEGVIEAKWNDSVLEIYAEDFNWSIVRNLEGNLKTITEQNLALLEAVAFTNTK